MLAPHYPVLARPAAHAAGTAVEFRRALLRRACVESGEAAAVECPGLRTAKMARLEAALFVADGPLSTRRLAQVATLADAAEARSLIDALNAAYDGDDSPFGIERVASGYQLLTRPVYARWLDRLHHRPARMKLSPPALETLTIIAYRQPITRAEVETIRGVQSADLIKQLMERGLVRIGGEDDSLGRPYLYETTRTFLEQFGLRSLDDLPMADELRRSEPAEDGSGEIVAETPMQQDDEPASDDSRAAVRMRG